MAESITGWPFKCQLDGSPNAANDCGEVCVAMSERYLFGPSPVLVSPDVIRQRILGPSGLGYSTVQQLSGYLAQHGIPNHWWGGSDAGADAPKYSAAMAQGRPNIGLFYADPYHPDPETGHFCDIIDIADDGTWGRANPWIGSEDYLPPAIVAQGYTGWGLIMDIDPATFQRKMGLAPAPPQASHPTFKVLFDGALHDGPSLNASVRRHVKKGDTLIAVTGDSHPWISLNLPDGTWGGWDLRSNVALAT